jgi:brefeldin A-resistance guanine nucleotide exchange factor 1
MRRSLRHPRSAAADAVADHPLVSSLKALRRLVFSPDAASSPSLSAATLRPFLEAVRFEEAGAAVTSASLAALHEVMALTGHSLPGSELREVVDAVVSCRFEAGQRPTPRRPC